MQKTKSAKVWSSTRVQGLMRHKNGRYYARLYVGSKEKWVSLKTTLFEIAKSRMDTDATILQVRSAQSRQKEMKAGKMTVGAAAELYTRELEQRVDLKPQTRTFYTSNLRSLESTWPELWTMDVRKVSEVACREWAAKAAAKYSARQYNHLLVTLKRLLDAAMRSGFLHHNPSKELKRRKEMPKKLTLPSSKQFEQFIEEMRKNRHPLARNSAEVAELLAYTGCRISEARRLKWENLDTAKGELFIEGDPLTGTKNWKTRRIPLFPALRKLLYRMGKRLEDEGKPLSGRLIQVASIEDSMKRAEQTVGMAHISHHDLRHYFATACIESGVDIMTVSRWLGHQDGGALAMKTYGHLRNEHSLLSAEKVRFSAIG